MAEEVFFLLWANNLKHWIDEQAPDFSDLG